MAGRILNIILFHTGEPCDRLPADDVRAVHIRQVLRMKPGDELYLGIVNGPRGKARICRDDPESGMRFEIDWEGPPPPSPAVHLLLGLPRPQTARRILREVTSMGAAAIHWFSADKGEPGYSESKLWQSGEWQRHVLAGAEQSFVTRLPEITHHTDLAALLESGLTGNCAMRAALDPYEAHGLFAHQLPPPKSGIWLALGAERGWSARERDLLRDNGFTLYSLGERILRMDTAVIAALALATAALQPVGSKRA